MHAPGSTTRSLRPAQIWPRANWRLFAACILLSMSCGSSTAAAADELTATSPEALREARLYRVVPDRSELRLLVYREGALAKFGHNHVISSQSVNGSVHVGEDSGSSSVTLNLPVASFEVDRPELRREEGDDFPGSLDEEAIRGTRTNMLGPAMLDAERYPEIRLASRQISGALPALVVTVDVQIREQVSQLQIPVEVTIDADHLTATGHFSFEQTAVGVKPFRVMLGALRVRDTVDVKFRITAVRATAAP